MHITLTLEHTIYLQNQLVELDLPQIALAGRSNVGKSSLINALAGRKSLAKISATPGKTRSLNFYRVLPPDYYLVDLPGYGYARCSKVEREKWGALIDRYLTTCPALNALLLLIDCRLPPQKPDLELAAYARQHRMPTLPVLTKADKCPQRDRSARVKEWQSILDSEPPLVVSAVSGLGIRELWSRLNSLARPDYAPPQPQPDLPEV